MTTSHAAWEALLDKFAQEVAYDEATGGLNTAAKLAARDALCKCFSDGDAERARLIASRTDAIMEANRLTEYAIQCREALTECVKVLEHMDTLRHIDPAFPALDKARAALAKNPAPAECAGTTVPQDRMPDIRPGSVGAGPDEQLTGACQCPACRGGVLHASDCAVHNAPALMPGRCNCGAWNSS